MNPLQLANERKDYRFSSLLEAQTPENPLQLFENWMQDALKASLEDATAMSLATSINNQPSCRIVLLKGVENDAFSFYTNYASRKGQELEENPQVAATFFWAKLERQVRIEGKVEKLSHSESEKYFHSRPLASQLSAAASPQSQPVASREALEKLLADKIEEVGNTPPPMPETWGGYAIQPTSIEFWQGGPNRLHDRILYQKTEQGWIKTRLAP